MNEKYFFLHVSFLLYLLYNKGRQWVEPSLGRVWWALAGQSVGLGLGQKDDTQALSTGLGLQARAWTYGPGLGLRVGPRPTDL